MFIQNANIKNIKIVIIFNEIISIINNKSIISIVKIINKIYKLNKYQKTF